MLTGKKELTVENVQDELKDLEAWKAERTEEITTLHRNAAKTERAAVCTAFADRARELRALFAVLQSEEEVKI